MRSSRSAVSVSNVVVTVRCRTPSSGFFSQPNLDRRLREQRAGETQLLHRGKSLLQVSPSQPRLSSLHQRVNIAGLSATTPAPRYQICTGTRKNSQLPCRRLQTRLLPRRDYMTHNHQKRDQTRRTVSSRLTMDPTSLLPHPRIGLKASKLLSVRLHIMFVSWSHLNSGQVLALEHQKRHLSRQITPRQIQSSTLSKTHKKSFSS